MADHCKQRKLSICYICDKNLDQLSLKEHNLAFRNNKSSDKESFKKKIHTIHTLHDGHKDYKCEFCGKLFLKKKLQRNIINHNLGNRMLGQARPNSITQV